MIVEFTFGSQRSIGKPGTANDDRYDLNKKCNEKASVEVITGIINGGN